MMIHYWMAGYIDQTLRYDISELVNTYIIYTQIVNEGDSTEKYITDFVCRLRKVHKIQDHGGSSRVIRVFCACVRIV